MGHTSKWSYMASETVFREALKSQEQSVNVSLLATSKQRAVVCSRYDTADSSKYASFKSRQICGKLKNSLGGSLGRTGSIRLLHLAMVLRCG
jgi:hypothetical protein